MRFQIAAAFLSTTVLAQDNSTEPGVISMPLGGGMMGANPCTYSPNTTCYPNPITPGWPLCCTIDSSTCTTEEPCFSEADIPTNFTDIFNMTGLPLDMGIGPAIPQPGMLGSNQCTYSPNATCYPNPVESGRPLCCIIDPSGQSCESDPMPCFEAPDITDILAQYNMTMADVQALVAEFMGGGGDEPTMDGGNGMLGANQCTYGLNETCYPNPVMPGRPLCCTIDPSGQSCEANPMPCFEASDLDEILAQYNMTTDDLSSILDNIDLSNVDLQDLAGQFLGGEAATGEPAMGGGDTMIGDEPAMGTEVPVDMSSSAILSMSLIALVSAHAVAFVTGMW